MLRAYRDRELRGDKAKPYPPELVLANEMITGIATTRDTISRNEVIDKMRAVLTEVRRLYPADAIEAFARSWMLFGIMGIGPDEVASDDFPELNNEDFPAIIDSIRNRPVKTEI